MKKAGLTAEFPISESTPHERLAALEALSSQPDAPLLAEMLGLSMDDVGDRLTMKICERHHNRKQYDSVHARYVCNQCKKEANKRKAAKRASERQ